MFLKIPKPTSAPFGPGSGRPLVEILKQRPLLAAIGAGMVSYGMMNLVMTAAPLAMVKFCGHSVNDATGVIRWHVLAMYLPSFFTGHLDCSFRTGSHHCGRVGLARGVCADSVVGISVMHFTVDWCCLASGGTLRSLVQPRR